MQSKLKDAEEVAAHEMVLRLAAERERDDLQSRWNAITENTSAREALEQELQHARSALKASDESAAEELSKIHHRLEQERLELSSTLKRRRNQWPRKKHSDWRRKNY